MGRIFASLSKVASLVALASITTVAVAHVNDLRINNSSRTTLSFAVNGVCSPEMGVVYASSVKNIPNRNLTEACRFNPHNCEMVAFSNGECRGYPFAAIYMDITSVGVMRVTSIDGTFTVGANGFELFFEGPWAYKK